MNRAFRRTGIGVAVVAAWVGIGGGAAQAAVVNPYTPQALCGLGYTTV
ncbi:hypothetical protein EV384_0594 [Micromonospora kangleipakensis]|uniref:Uncharacterized protein n=1 Tax=Micromonospora kangleipakensis TaxID=1077942 RepID=A0A4Q8B3Y5_9ACTN|nr:hypothetical protein [Micromonospora kangleipakensis]RZU72242.1 hypothetical protein EV384_0594 [Micromonospora kangleipakensis]